MVPLKSLPADVHVHIVIGLYSFFCDVEANAAPPCAVQDERRTAETVERPGCVHTCSVLTGVSKFTLIIIHTLEPDVVVVEAGATVAGVSRKQIGTLSILTNV